MSLITSTYRKARKEHTCSYCGRTIKAGDTYLADNIADNGTVYNWKTCKQCEQLLEKYPLYDYTGDGIDCWDFFDHVQELCNEKGIDSLNMQTEEMVDALLKEDE